MPNDPTTLTYTLEEVLSRFEQKMDRQFAEVNQKMDRQFAEVNQKMDRQFAEVNQKFAEVNQKFAEVNQKLEKMDSRFDKIDERLNKLEVGQAELSEKVSGIDKRLDNQEFINRGVLVSLIVALIGGAAKLFGWLPPN
jgi:septal ring factor EnvC (AmiA/AmiB activator)